MLNGKLMDIWNWILHQTNNVTNNNKLNIWYTNAYDYNFN